MLKRRDVLLGVPLLMAAGAAVALTPRNRLNLLGDYQIEDMVPLAFNGWQVSPSNAVILPEAEEGSLSDTLYDQTVSRLYMGEGKMPVMMVIAYGSTQSDQLQLHRPEVCYAAFGFEISRSTMVDVPVAPAPDVLPARELVATSNERTEPILYWTRVGDFLPTSGREQRVMKLRTEMAGYVADGVLVRLSTVGEPTPATFAALQDFAKAMLQATKAQGLAALVGRPLAAAMNASRPAVATVPSVAVPGKASS